MFSDAVREAVRKRLIEKRPVKEIAREFDLSECTVWLWKRTLVPRRPKRSKFESTASAGLWKFGAPREEARSLLVCANRNGGIQHMRETIAVSEQQRAELFALVDQGQLARHLVEACLAYREKVLVEFNRIAGQL